MSDDTSTPSAQPTSGTGQDPATVPKPTAPPSAPATPSGDQEATATIARLESELAARGKQRVSAKQKAADEARTQLAQDIGRALGLVEDDTPPDPAASGSR